MTLAVDITIKNPIKDRYNIISKVSSWSDTARPAIAIDMKEKIAPTIQGAALPYGVFEFLIITTSLVFKRRTRRWFG